MICSIGKLLLSQNPTRLGFFAKILLFLLAQKKIKASFHFSLASSSSRTCVYPLGRSASSIKLNINKKRPYK